MLTLRIYPRLERKLVFIIGQYYVMLLVCKMNFHHETARLFTPIRILTGILTVGTARFVIDSLWQQIMLGSTE
jgi:hypothetical protein